MSNPYKPEDPSEMSAFSLEQIQELLSNIQKASNQNIKVSRAIVDFYRQQEETLLAKLKNGSAIVEIDLPLYQLFQEALGEIPSKDPDVIYHLKRPSKVNYFKESYQELRKNYIDENKSLSDLYSLLDLESIREEYSISFDEVDIDEGEYNDLGSEIPVRAVRDILTGEIPENKKQEIRNRLKKAILIAEKFGFNLMNMTIRDVFTK